jgi:nucleotide-binding universal stress UspA family protein
MEQLRNGHVDSPPASRPAPASASAPRAEHTDRAPSPAKKSRVLAVLDGSQSDDRVIDCLLDMPSRGMQLSVVLLNVQPKPQAWQTRPAGGSEARERLPAFRGRRVVRGARRRLEPAGIAILERIEFGPVVEAVVKCARQESCDAIVLAAPRVGRTGQWLARNLGLCLGSLPSDVMQRSAVPLVVVIAHRNS